MEVIEQITYLLFIRRLDERQMLAEKINGVFKTELIIPGKPWKSIVEVEIATAEWIDWFYYGRLSEYWGTFRQPNSKQHAMLSLQPHTRWS